MRGDQGGGRPPSPGSPFPAQVPTPPTTTGSVQPFPLQLIAELLLVLLAGASLNQERLMDTFHILEYWLDGHAVP
jgi:hypothetical protein